MTPQLVYSLVRRFRPAATFTLALMLLLFSLHGAAFAQAGHVWNGIAGAEDVPYDESYSSSGESYIWQDAISGDGRFITFWSSKTDLVPPPHAGGVFVRDRMTRQTDIISVAPNGAPANGESNYPTISANGRHIAFRSCATNLVPGDSNGWCDIFVRDRLLGTTVRVNYGPSGEELYNWYVFYSISADGRYIAFPAGFTPSSSDQQVWLRDRDTDGDGVFDEPGAVGTTRISVSTVGSASLEYARSAALSANARVIAYSAYATQDGVDGNMLFVYNRQTGLTTRVDVPVNGLPDVSGFSHFYQDLDDEGRYLVYTSDAPNLVENDGDAIQDLFLADLQIGGNTRLRLSHEGAPSLEGYWTPSISGDGRYVAFMGQAMDQYGNYVMRSFGIDRQGASYEISVNADGNPPYYPGRGGPTSISADGSAIVFEGSYVVNWWEPDGDIYVAVDMMVSPTTVEMSSAGGPLLISVSAPDTTGWMVRTPYQGQIELPETAGGIGTGVATINVMQNDTGEALDMFASIGSEMVQIHQPPAPTVFGVDPSVGPVTGGTVITIHGQCFVQGSTVTVGGVQATDITVLSATTVQATTPPGASRGRADLFVINPDGGTGRFEYGFYYLDATPPVIIPTLSGTIGNDGWYTSDVAVTWEVSDPESEIEHSNCLPFTIDFDGSIVGGMCTARSEGGTTSESVQFKRDATPPEIMMGNLSDGGTYARGEQVQAMYFCEDPSDGSGLSQCSGTLPADAFLDTSQSGTFTFTVTALDVAGNQAARTVSYTVAKSIPALVWPTPDPISYGTPLGAVQLNGSADVPGTFIYTPAAGTIFPAGTHTLHAAFVPNDPANYETAGKSVSIEVRKAIPIIAWAAPGSMSYGTPLSVAQLNATANVGGVFTYTPASGTVLPAGVHLLNVAFAPNDPANYESGSASVPLTVQKGTPVISWTSPGSIIYGMPLGAAQLNATANVAGSFFYTPAAGTVLPAGIHTLNVSFVPNDSANYETAGASVQFTIQKVTPEISWAAPGNIVYGMALGAAQLNATAGVAGSLAYAPLAGTILPAGTHTLSVVFTPADPANHNTAYASVPLTVIPAPLTVRADNSAKVYGQAVPAFTATVTGFVAGDGMASLGGVLAFSTAANEGSAPGVYPVSPGGVSSPNYAIAFVAGTLTIAKASTSTALSTTPNPSLNKQMVQITATVSAVAPGAGMPSGIVQFLDNGSVLGSAPLVNGVATISKSLRRGSHNLTANYAGDLNFTTSSGTRLHQVR
jgi:Tol biopolymer transport system component